MEHEDEPPTETSHETESLTSSVKAATELSPRHSFSTENISENNHVIEGINCFMSLSKLLEIKERENSVLRNEIDELKAENEVLNKGVETHQLSLEKQQLLESTVDELKLRLKAKNDRFGRERKMLQNNHETMQSRLEEMEYQKISSETKAAKLETILQNFKKSSEFSKSEDSNESDSKLEASNKESSKILKASEDLQKSLIEKSEAEKEELQSKLKASEDLVAKLSSTVDKLEKKTESDRDYIKKLEQDTLEIISLRSQIKIITEPKNLSSELPTDMGSMQHSTLEDNKITESENRVRIAVQDLIEQMENHSQNRRLSMLPPTLQLEPPVAYESSETFCRVIELLKVVATAKKVSKKTVQEFWDSLINRANLVEEVIRNKSEETRRLAGDEINRMDKEHAEEKEKILEELREVEVLARDRLTTLSETTQKHKLALSDKEEKIKALYRKNSNLYDNIKEYKVALTASLQASKSDKAAEILPQICIPSTIECEHEDYRQQLEDLKISSTEIEDDLKNKLAAVEKELASEKQKNRVNVPSKTVLRPKKEPLEATLFKVDKKPNGVFRPREYLFTNTGKAATITDKEEGSEKIASRKDPEDKDWILSKFLEENSNAT